jgi:hypothetical protein
MKHVIYLLFDLLNTLTKLLRLDGRRTVIAENLRLKRSWSSTDPPCITGFSSLSVPKYRCSQRRPVEEALSRTISVAGSGLKWEFASDRPAPKKFASHCAMEVG